MELMPRLELESRWDRLRGILVDMIPAARGLLVFSRINIYYLTGTFANGLLWFPMEGQPVLLCRRGRERARLESPIDNIFEFKTYRDIEGILKQAGIQLAGKIAVEMNGLPWSLGKSLAKNLSSCELVPGDKAIAFARQAKSQWELEIMRDCGARHAKCLDELLPSLIKEGMTEFEIARIISDLFFSRGHQGMLRMGAFGEEAYLGHVSAGDSGNYPSVFNGALGLRGVHPAMPHMGSNEKTWQRGEPLTIDCGFTYQGYQTDKTQVYWLGQENSIPGEAQEAQRFCIDMQEWIRMHLKPGIVPCDIWDHCALWAVKAGWADGFMGLDGNKVEFVGHGIGLTIDEYPVLAGGFDRPLEKGMVIAIEPKIGIPGFGMVGLENTFEVTDDGGRSLTGEDYQILCLS